LGFLLREGSIGEAGAEVNSDIGERLKLPFTSVSLCIRDPAIRVKLTSFFTNL